MKYCLIGPTYPFRGGIAHYTTLLVRHMRERHEVRFYSYRRQYPRWLFPGSVAPDPSKTPILEPGEQIIDGLNPLTWWRTAKSIVADKPDVLLLQWWTPFWLPLLLVVSLAAHRARIPILYLCHQLNEPDSSFDEWFFARLALRIGDAIIVMSQKELTMVKRDLPGKPVRVGHLPVFDQVPVRGFSRDQARRFLNIPSDDSLLLFFGFVRHYKGLPFVLEALPQLPASVRLLVAGQFWEEEQSYRNLIGRLGLESRVIIHNRYVPNEEIEPYFVAADALVLPYLTGSQSAVGMVAVQFGLPIIATSVGGLAETINNGEIGLVVPAADSGALAAALERFFGENLGSVFRSRMPQAQERLSWAALIQLVEELSHDITGGETTGRVKSFASGADSPVRSHTGLQ